MQFSTSLALEKTEDWQKEVISLEHSVPSNHPILQACLRAIGNFQKYLPLLLKLGSQFLRASCWKEIFAGEEALIDPGVQVVLWPFPIPRGWGWGAGDPHRPEISCPEALGRD